VYLLSTIVWGLLFHLEDMVALLTWEGRPPVGKHVGQLVVPIKLISVFTFHLFNEIIIILRLAFRKI
jgi:hypothetical protein